VFRANGSLVGRERVQRGRCFRVRLAPGRYQLNAGVALHPGLGCPPSSFTIRRRYITDVDAFEGCLVP
jgi:hypothetical protein